MSLSTEQHVATTAAGSDWAGGYWDAAVAHAKRQGEPVNTAFPRRSAERNASRYGDGEAAWLEAAEKTWAACVAD